VPTAMTWGIAQNLKFWGFLTCSMYRRHSGACLWATPQSASAHAHVASARIGEVAQLQLLHQLHLFQDPAVIKLRWFLDVITDCQCECSRAEQCHRPNAHLLDFKTSFNILDCVAAAKGQERLQMQRSSPLPPVWLAFDAVCTL